jgi:diaminobutyrate-2-oxoglutarate transaminase
LAGAGALPLGHSHPIVIEAMQRLLSEGTPLQTLDLTTPIKDNFVQTLFASLPQTFAGNARIQFCGPSGADSVEAALKLVKTATGKRAILAFRGGYHGMTHGALGLMGAVAAKNPISGLMPDVHFLPFPYAYRCPLGLGGELGTQASLDYIERLLNDTHSGIVSPAAMILEVVQGEGGVIPAPDYWLREIRRITAEHGIALIIDEIQTGIGRTGHLYAFEQAGIEPDVLLLSKAVGGSLPLSVMVYKQNLDTWQAGAHAGTFRGNQLAMATGAACLRYIQGEKLHQHAATMGHQLQEQLRYIQQQFPQLGDIRGRGLMVGVEIVDSQATPDHIGSYPANPNLARALQSECLNQGLILELGGRNNSVVRFIPPLIVNSEEINCIAAIFEQALRIVMKKYFN